MILCFQFIFHYICVYFQVGKCVCKPGFYGKNCDDPCEDGFYGRYCQNPCNCGKSFKCDGVTGSCLYNCPAGRTGEKCDQGTMTYIFNCSVYLQGIIQDNKIGCI